MSIETSQVVIDDGERQLFEMSRETSDLINALNGVNVGQTITYDDLSAIAMGDIRGRCSSNLRVARSYLEREKHILFGVVRNVGLKRASDIEVVQESEKGLVKIRKAAKKAAGKTVCVHDFGSLPEDVKIRHNAALSIFGAISLATSTSKVRQIKSEVKMENDRISIGRTLELFSR